MREVEVTLNNIVRTTTGRRKCDHVTPLYNELKFLKLCDIYKLELRKFGLPMLQQRDITTTVLKMQFRSSCKVKKMHPKESLGITKMRQ